MSPWLVPLAPGGVEAGSQGGRSQKERAKESGNPKAIGIFKNDKPVFST